MTVQSPDDWSPAAFRPLDAIPSDEQVKDDPIAKDVWKQFEAARGYDRRYKKAWPRYHALYESRHWDGTQKRWMSTPVINLIYGYIDTMTAILTDGRPQIQVVATKPESEGKGQVLAHIIEWLWEANDMDVKLPSTVKNSLIFGNGFLKVLWDPSARNGLGDIKIAELDPSLVFVSPHARILEDADYVIHAENVPKKQVQRLYPDYQGSGKKNAGPMDERVTLNREPGPSDGSLGTNPNLQLPDGSGGVAGVAKAGVGAGYQSDGDGDSLVTVIERWMRDGTGQIWQTVVCNKEVMLHRPSPFKHGLFPIIHLPCSRVSWSFWAMGDIQPVEQLQMEVNRRRGHIMDILRYTANPMLVVDPGMMPDWERLEPRPGLVIPAEGGPQSAQWLQSPGVPAALFEVNQLDKGDFDVVLGNVEVLQGRRPSGVEAGVAIEMLQDAASVRPRGKARNLENAIRNLGRVLLGMIQQFYTTERVFRVVGNEMQQLEGPITNDPEAAFMFINRPMVDPATGQVVMQNEVPPVEEADFDVRVGPGSTLPVSRSAQFGRAIQMQQMGLASPELVWKYSGFPRWKEEMEKAQLWQAQMMMLQQQQAMQQGVAGGTAPPMQTEIPDSEVDMALEENAPLE